MSLFRGRSFYLGEAASVQGRGSLFRVVGLCSGRGSLSRERSLFIRSLSREGGLWSEEGGLCPGGLCSGQGSLFKGGGLCQAERVSVQRRGLC